MGNVVKSSTTKGSSEKKQKEPLPEEPRGIVVSSNKIEKKSLQLKDFQIFNVIGLGFYSKVFLVRKKDSKKYYAMKMMKKDLIVERDDIELIMTERKILECYRHPFIVRLHFAFQDKTNLYLLQDFAGGGELFYHLKREDRLEESRVRLYAMELILALKFLHSNGIIYRDLKPENILIGNDGHILLTDLGLAKQLKHDGEKCITFVGTSCYLAPSVILGRKYDGSIDYWCLGVLIYELIVGLPPFYCEDVNDMYDMILHGDVYFPEKLYVSPACKDLIMKLLRKEPDKRIQVNDIMKHPWFTNKEVGYTFKEVLDKKIKPPFVPIMKGKNDCSYINEEFLNMKKNTIFTIQKKFENKVKNEMINKRGIDIDNKNNITNNRKVLAQTPLLDGEDIDVNDGKQSFDDGLFEGYSYHGSGSYHGNNSGNKLINKMTKEGLKQFKVDDDEMLYVKEEMDSKKGKKKLVDINWKEFIYTTSKRFLKFRDKKEEKRKSKPIPIKNNNGAMLGEEVSVLKEPSEKRNRKISEQFDRENGNIKINLKVEQQKEKQMDNDKEVRKIFVKKKAETQKKTKNSDDLDDFDYDCEIVEVEESESEDDDEDVGEGKKQHYKGSMSIDSDDGKKLNFFKFYPDFRGNQNSPRGSLRGKDDDSGSDDERVISTSPFAPKKRRNKFVPE